MQKLVGSYDENIDAVSRELGVSVAVDGVNLKITGEEQAAETARRVFEGLLALLRAGETVDKSRIAYCIELAKEGNADAIGQIVSGVIAVTSRGKQIKCKTVGQKKYVEAIKKNTVVFGIGPAGTGKTYLAVCAAVSAFKGICQCTFLMFQICYLRNFFLSRIVVFIAFAYDTKTIAECQMFYTHIHQMFADCNTCRTCTVNDDFNFAHFFFNQFQRIDQRSRYDDCRTVLVIMENRNIADFLQFSFNLKAARSRNILKVDASETS